MTDTSSPISTGGAGVTFEQHLGAYVLSHLLAKTPLGILHLGTPTTVRFQQKDLSSVDDLIIEGRAGHSKKTISVAARITPKFIPSDAATVKLFASILAAFQQHEEEITSGRWSLAIVSQNSTHVDELEQLTQIARAQKNEFEFEKAVANRSKSIQSRYSHVVEVIAAARSALGSYPGTWRLLKHLFVMPAAFEAPLRQLP